jgi:hypothetical protein
MPRQIGLTQLAQVDPEEQDDPDRLIDEAEMLQRWRERQRPEQERRRGGLVPYLRAHPPFGVEYLPPGANDPRVSRRLMTMEEAGTGAAMETVQPGDFPITVPMDVLEDAIATNDWRRLYGVVNEQDKLQYGRPWRPGQPDWPRDYPGLGDLRWPGWQDEPGEEEE